MYLDGIETARLQIRKLEMSDLEIWKTFFDNNDSLNYLGLDLSVGHETIAKEWIERQQDRYENHGLGLMALIDKESDNFIGQCGLIPQEVDGEKCIEVGYHVLPKYWGNGYAPEAAIKLRDFAFENNIADHLISIIDINNVNSQKVAVKNGMSVSKRTQFKGMTVDIYRIDRDNRKYTK